MISWTGPGHHGIKKMHSGAPVWTLMRRCSLPLLEGGRQSPARDYPRETLGSERDFFFQINLLLEFFWSV